MSYIQIRILKNLSNSPKSRKDIKTKFKHKNIDRIIEDLRSRNYIEPIIIGSDKYKTTQAGREYKETLNKKRIRILKLIGLIAGIVSSGITIIAFILQHQTKETINKTALIYNNLPFIKKDSTFFLKDYFLYNGLKDSIEKESKYLNSPSSSRIIEITYSGSLVPTEEHYYYYTGGNIIIKYNGNIVFNIDTLKIEKTNTIGNLEEELKTELNKRSIKLVNKYNRLFIDDIIFILSK